MIPPKPLLPFVRLPLRDDIKTLLLLALSLVTFPLSYILATILTNVPPSWISYLFPFSSTTPAFAAVHSALSRSEPHFKQRTILVTGVGMTKGLALARAFWLCGHRVVAADFDAERCSMWTPWRGKGKRWTFSCCFDAVYSLKQPLATNEMSEREKRDGQKAYVRDLTKIVFEEDVDLWVSCSGVASAQEDAMVKEVLDSSQALPAGRTAKVRSCIQFDVPTTGMLHEKSSFIRRARELGLLVPETYDVFSHDDVLQALTKAIRTNPERRFILKPVGMDDANRGNMTLLPLSTHRDTKAHVQGLPISKERPWILQQFIRGNKEYCTHSLVVNGEVKAFVACLSSELLMHYSAMSPDDPLSKEMFEFTHKFAEAEKKAGKTFTGHLSFDFMAEENDRGATSLYAIECNPRAHTAVALFATPGAEMRQMVGAYLSALQISSHHDGSPTKPPKQPKQHGIPIVVTPSSDATPRYWIGHDLVVLVLLPLWRLITWKASRKALLDSVEDFIEHVSSWQDGTFELWDPWPFVALYHHYWPRAILAAWLKGERWSRVNVSTTKMFIR